MGCGASVTGTSDAMSENEQSVVPPTPPPPPIRKVRKLQITAMSDKKEHPVLPPARPPPPVKVPKHSSKAMPDKKKQSVSAPSPPPPPVKVVHKFQVVNKPQPNPKPKEKLQLKPMEKAHSKKQLEKWMSSINALLLDEEGFNAFRKFLEAEETDPAELTKYLDFYKECEEFRLKMVSIEDDALRICDTYLEVGSDREVSTEGEGRQVVEQLEEGDCFSSKDLFTVSQKKAKDKMEIMFYANFCEHIKKKYKL